jgi:hypothetical protein
LPYNLHGGNQHIRFVFDSQQGKELLGLSGRKAAFPKRGGRHELGGFGGGLETVEVFE